MSIIVFNSAALDDEGPAFDRYRELYMRGADALALDASFAVTLAGIPLDRAVLFDRRLVGVGHERTAARCKRDDLDHFTLTLVIGGSFHIDTGTGFTAVQPGEIVLVDTMKPMRNRAPHAHIITMSIARDRIAAVAGDHVERLHGHRIAAPRARLLADHLTSLARSAGELPRHMLLPLSRISTDFLAMALDTDLAGDDLFRRQSQRWRSDQIASYIEQHLTDPSFSPADACKWFGISRATLYRAFDIQGGFVRHLRRRRLSMLRDRLADGVTDTSLEQLAAAFGFANETQASQAFLTEYGTRPSRYRRTTRQETALHRARRRMDEWTADLR